MQIHQLTVKYDAEEDRLLLRINTLDRRELRFWLTRRFTGLLMPVLDKMLAQSPERLGPAPARATPALVDFERERVLASADFETRFEEAAASFPLGETPLLLARIQAGRKGNREVVSLTPKAGAGIELPAQPRILHTLANLIRTAADRAGWRLTPPVTAPDPIPRTLH